ncbi:MAG: PhoH family protein [Verrucomicrobiae bacterium]|nr:PhoH family protein [Verrucomicrobiae bacterium]
MPEEKLEFENPRLLQSLYAGNPQNLKKLEETLLVTVTTRDGWVRFEGKKEDVLRARQVFDHLLAAHHNGIVIRNHEFNYTLHNVLENRGDQLASLHAEKLKISATRGSVSPKTFNQRDYLERIRSHDVSFGIGPAGTGKTYLAVAMAVSFLKSERVKRIILTRPAVETGESLGYLPGDLREKISPYLRPLYDALNDMLPPEEVAKAMEKNIIEIAPLAYMRGRTLSSAFVILDEAQNTTAEQMFMFLTRLGVGSTCVITGDITQTDLPANKKSGLVEAVAALRGVEEISFTYFDEKDVIRHEIVARIVSAYKRHREPLNNQK